MKALSNLSGKYKLSKYLVIGDRSKDLSNNSQFRMLYSTRSGICFNISEHNLQDLYTGKIDKLSENFLEELKINKILVPENENELSLVIDENNEEIQTSKTLYQVIQPSAWCQLDCGYCGQQHSKKLMSSTAQDNFLERFTNRLKVGTYTHCEICWFGAEPTAGINVMRDLSPKLQEISAYYNCTYSARIVTNGMTLTSKLANELYKLHKIKEAEVTLDGTSNFHNKRRFTKLGKDSFAQILLNIINSSKLSSLKIVVRCNVDKENSSSVSSLIRLLHKNDLQDRIQFYTAPIHSWGNDAHKSSLSIEKYAEMELNWIALQIRLGFKVGLLPPRKKIVCMAVRRDTELIDAQDYSFNCTEVSQVPAYGKPNSYAIRLPGENKIINSENANILAKFNDNVKNGKRDQCHNCRMLPVCGGACPKAWEDGHPPCPATKYNIESRLSLVYAMNKIQTNNL